MTIIDLNRAFSTEAKCREYLKRLRWPNGVRCPRCDNATVSTLQAQGKFECAKCEYQFSVTAGSIFHDSHLPLEKWFFATYLMCESRKGISANQLKRTLGVSYKTAWYLCHRIRAAMKDADNHSEGEYVRGQVHTNTIESAFSLFKRSIVGAYHQISAKHLDAYLDEFEFRFNRRRRADLFADTIKHLVTADPLTFSRLTGEE